MIIANGNADLFQEDEDGRTSLHWACSTQNSQVIKALTPQFRVHFDESASEILDISDWLPLHILASVGNLVLLEYLLQQFPSSNINAGTNTGTTVLQLAISKRCIQLAKWLLTVGKSSYGLRAGAKDKRGLNALHRAASVGSVELVELLVNEGKVNVNSTDGLGWTSLHHAMSEEHVTVAEKLLDLGADWEAVTSEGESVTSVCLNKKVVEEVEKHKNKLN
ncbi:uncharacterized protein KQ657_000574 [Scheffersomyces spartinae]|uniref:Ankyrin n=1 Tax=Scheffersomyces spartinae TaxID=45513 RepID=A0A9P7V8V0_9ASCO|nr:uncharacterized protein KQ657_000574 [Scheffersomyces spartinae]KAG7193507.1 hypothetical protein KQ657_000574 [Scheffersomyces spartinae]